VNTMEAAASPSLGQPMTPAVDELVDTHHRAFFSFIPAQFLADLSTIVRGGVTTVLCTACCPFVSRILWPHGKLIAVS